jgi:hypothetical protein
MGGISDSTLITCHMVEQVVWIVCLWVNGGVWIGGVVRWIWQWGRSFAVVRNVTGLQQRLPHLPISQLNEPTGTKSDVNITIHQADDFDIVPVLHFDPATLKSG